MRPKKVNLFITLEDEDCTEHWGNHDQARKTYGPGQNGPLLHTTSGAAQGDTIILSEWAWIV